MLVVFRGLPGTGKSHLVRRLVKVRPGFLVLSRDTIRDGMVPHPTFSESEKDLVDDLVVAMTRFLLARGRDVVIDGMALSSAARVDDFLRAADAHGVPALVVECTCAEATALERLGRDHGGHPAGDRGEALYHRVKARWEVIARPVLTVETSGENGRPLAAILEQIGIAGAQGEDHRDET
jgi:predicted kinase